MYPNKPSGMTATHLFSFLTAVQLQHSIIQHQLVVNNRSKSSTRNQTSREFIFFCLCLVYVWCKHDTLNVAKACFHWGEKKKKTIQRFKDLKVREVDGQVYCVKVGNIKKTETQAKKNSMGVKMKNPDLCSPAVSLHCC